MSDSVIFPRGTIVKKVYSYTLEYENKEVSVVFLNYGDYQHTGADHSCAIELREDFARKLIEVDMSTSSTKKTVQKWRPLPEHEYLKLLAQNGFHYNSFNICYFREERIHISIKMAPQATPKLTPEAYSRFFPDPNAHFSKTEVRK